MATWFTTGMRTTESARRHGVGDEAIRLVDTDDGLFVIGRRIRADA